MRRMARRKQEELSAPRQRDILCDVMLSARECGAWLTLEEIEKLTHFPQASISAQLRHLRKPLHGGFLVEKRPRRDERGSKLDECRVVWEYRFGRPRTMPLFDAGEPSTASKALQPAGAAQAGRIAQHAGVQA